MGEPQRAIRAKGKKGARAQETAHVRSQSRSNSKERDVEKTRENETGKETLTGVQKIKRRIIDIELGLKKISQDRVKLVSRQQQLKRELRVTMNQLHKYGQARSTLNTDTEDTRQVSVNKETENLRLRIPQANQEGWRQQGNNGSSANLGNKRPPSGGAAPAHNKFAIPG